MRRFWLYGLPLYTYALGVFTTAILDRLDKRVGYVRIERLHTP